MILLLSFNLPASRGFSFIIFLFLVVIFSFLLTEVLLTFFVKLV